VRQGILNELKVYGHESLNYARSTFQDLADYFEKVYLKPAQFVDGRKVSGRRSLPARLSELKALRASFGRRSIRSITHGNLQAYKEYRLQTPTKKGQRAIATVNRELSLLRRMLNVAVQEGWLHLSPFKRGDSLISAADERKRQRILTLPEEERLLHACEGRPAYLRALIVCALDSGMRHGEMLKLRVGDVSFVTDIITIEATHTKTLTARRVKMTQRLRAELQPLCDSRSQDSRVFGIVNNVKRSWTAVRKAAGLPDVHFHDLRHTNATRVERTGRVSLAQLARHLGHSDIKTTYRYVNQDEEAVTEIAEATEEVTTKVREKAETVH